MMMKVFKVTEDDIVYHWVISRNEELARKFIKDGNFLSDDTETLNFEEVPLNEELTIDLGKKITHTIEDWIYIYDFKPRYLACSEY